MAKKRAATRKKPGPKISSARGKFFLTIRGRKAEIPGVSAEQVKSAVGQPIEPVLYKSAVVAIKWRPGPGILCYIPAPDIINKIAPEVQRSLLNAFVQNGIITAEQGKEIAGGG